MKSRSYITILTIAFCLTNVFTSCAQSKNEKTTDIIKIKKSTISIQFDTLKTAIIPFDQKGNYPFNNSYKPTTFTQIDINIVDSLIIECVTEYNNSLDKDHKEWSIDLKKYNYQKQLIIVSNYKGEKEVWVNYFCDTWNKNWKKEILLVHDGGNCYFNFKINLATKTFYDLSVNGEA